MEISTDYIISFIGSIYDIFRSVWYFVFEYKVIGGSGIISYTNPFTNVKVNFDLPSFGDGRIGGAVVNTIEKWFDINLSITFFDILVGPLLFIVLAYAVIKYLIPSS